MITVVVVSSILIVITYVSIASRLNILQLCIGHNATVDILFTVLVSGAALMTGSLTGLLMAVVTGFFITVTLVGMRKYFPYQRIVRKSRFKFGIQSFEAEKELPFLKSFQKLKTVA